MAVPTGILVRLAALSLMWTAVPGHVLRPSQQSNDQSIRASGLRLSLTVTRARVPRDALVWVTVRARNISDRVVNLFQSRRDLDPAIMVQVLDPRGRVVYPPPVAGVIGLPGQEPTLVHLQPGATLRQRHLVVTRFARLRPVARLEVLSGRGVEVRGATLRLRLVAGHPPRVAIQHAGGGVSARIFPAGRVTGPLRYFYSATCQYGSSQPVLRSSESWTTVRGNRVWPGCPHAVEWRAVAGWIGAPVARIQLGRPENP